MFELNRDFLTAPAQPVPPAHGPALGFLDAYEAAWEAQVRTQSVFGLEAALRVEEEDQYRRLKQAGVEPPRLLNDNPSFTGGINSNIYLRMARVLVDGYKGDGTDDDIVDKMKARDDQLRRLANDRPDLAVRSYADMFEEVKRKAQAAEARGDLSWRGIGGVAGGFIGSAQGSLDPRTDPFNLITAPLAWGRTALGRIAAQGGIQAGTEAVNQATGVAENRRLLGLESSFGRSATQVAMAGAFGGIFQGGQEAFGAGVRAGARWFKGPDAPPIPDPPPLAPRAPPPAAAAPPVEPAPLPPGTQAPLLALPHPGSYSAADTAVERIVVPSSHDPIIHVVEDYAAFEAALKHPYGTSPEGINRAILDLQTVSRQLNDFEGPEPWAVRPATDTALPRAINEYRISGLTEASATARADNRIEVLNAARAVDPETFAKYDRLTKRIATVKNQIDDMETAAWEQLSQDLLVLEQRAAKGNSTSRKQAAAEIKRLKGLSDEELLAHLMQNRMKGRDAIVADIERQTALAAEAEKQMKAIRGGGESRKNKRAELAAQRDAALHEVEQGKKQLGIMDAEDKLRASYETSISALKELTPVIERAVGGALGAWRDRGPKQAVRELMRQLEDAVFTLPNQPDPLPPITADPLRPFLGTVEYKKGTAAEPLQLRFERLKHNVMTPEPRPPAPREPRPPSGPVVPDAVKALGPDAVDRYQRFLAGKAKRDAEKLRLEEEAKTAPEEPPATPNVDDRYPILKRDMETAADAARKGGDVVDQAAAVAAKMVDKDMETGLAVAASVRAALRDLEKAGDLPLLPDGRRAGEFTLPSGRKLHVDDPVLVDGDGNAITVRQLVEELDEVGAELTAATTCAIL